MESLTSNKPLNSGADPDHNPDLETGTTVRILQISCLGGGLWSQSASSYL